MVDGRARLFVPGRDGPTSVEAVRAWSRPALGANAFQSSNEVPEVIGEAVMVGHAGERGRFTLEPPIDRPRPREAAPGPALGDGPRDRDQQLRREHGQPSVLLVDLGHVRLVAREPDGLVVAEPERCVIPSVKLNRTDLELRPLWELLGDEAGDDLGGDPYLLHVPVVVAYLRA